MVTSEYPPIIAGISHYVYNLSNSLIKKGHKVTVITRGSWKGLLINCSKNINIYRLPYLQLYPFHAKIYQFFQSRIFRKLESNFDLVHIHHPFSPPVNTTLPKLVTFHSSLGELESGSIEAQNNYSLPNIPKPLLSLIGKYFRIYEHKVIANVDLISTVSNALANELKNHYKLIDDSINVLGNGVDTNLFTPVNIKDNGTYILYTGRLSWNKGLIDLIRSAKKIIQRYPDISFVITGRGPIEHYLRELVTNMKLDNNFSFLGFVDMKRLIKTYQNASIYIFPSYYEGLPTSLLEAMACGVPVIATGVGGIPEVVNDGKNGFIVPIKNPEAIANSVIKLLENQKSRKKMGKIARKTIEENYSWDSIASKALEYYRTITK
jgi:glycosyltransferase involved in cell wall biosynthesis